jgi:mxaD protein
MAAVSVSKRYEVPPEEMWARIGDPGALAAWHPAIEATEVFDGGRTRVNLVVGGGRVAETILELTDRRQTWRIDESPLPYDLVATLQVRDDGGAACVVEWNATFEPNGVSEPEAAEMIRGFFQAGLDAL